MSAMTAYTLEQLVTAVNTWCEANNLTPANGQSAEHLSLRTLRYYRSMGLLNGPTSGVKQAYGEIHRLQLLAIRVLQAHGLPLRRIQSLLYGRSEAELRHILKKGTVLPPIKTSPPIPQAGEDWRVMPIDPFVWLILRNGRSLSPDQISRIQNILATPSPTEASAELETETTS